MPNHCECFGLLHIFFGGGAERSFFFGSRLRQAGHKQFKSTHICLSGPQEFRTYESFDVSERAILIWESRIMDRMLRS